MMSSTIWKGSPIPIFSLFNDRFNPCIEDLGTWNVENPLKYTSLASNILPVSVKYSATNFQLPHIISLIEHLFIECSVCDKIPLKLYKVGFSKVFFVKISSGTTYIVLRLNTFEKNSERRTFS